MGTARCGSGTYPLSGTALWAKSGVIHIADYGERAQEDSRKGKAPLDTGPRGVNGTIATICEKMGALVTKAKKGKATKVDGGVIQWTGHASWER